MPYKDPVKKQEYAKAYRVANKERIYEQTAKWKKENKVRAAQLNSASWYRRCNADVTMYLKHLHKYSRRRTKEHLITTDDVVRLWEEQGGRCALTGVPMTHNVGHGRKTGLHTNVSIDRLDPTRGYVTGNVRLVCFIVNVMRRDMDDQEFRHWCRLVISKPYLASNNADDSSDLHEAQDGGSAVPA